MPGGALEVSAKHNIASGPEQYHFAEELGEQGIWGAGAVRQL